MFEKMVSQVTCMSVIRKGKGIQRHLSGNRLIPHVLFDWTFGWWRYFHVFKRKFAWSQSRIWIRNSNVLDGGDEVGAWKLGSDSTALVCGATEFLKRVPWISVFN